MLEPVTMAAPLFFALVVFAWVGSIALIQGLAEHVKWSVKIVRKERASEEG